jgi:hypothetical protein
VTMVWLYSISCDIYPWWKRLHSRLPTFYVYLNWKWKMFTYMKFIRPYEYKTSIVVFWSTWLGIGNPKLSISWNLHFGSSIRRNGIVRDMDHNLIATFFMRTICLFVCNLWSTWSSSTCPRHGLNHRHKN